MRLIDFGKRELARRVVERDRIIEALEALLIRTSALVLRYGDPVSEAKLVEMLPDALLGQARVMAEDLRREEKEAQDAAMQSDAGTDKPA